MSGSDTDGKEECEETAVELIAAAADQVTLDEYMRRNPRLMTDADLQLFAAVQRRNRARFLKGDSERRTKRKG